MPSKPQDEKMVVAKRVTFNATEDDLKALEFLKSQYHIQNMSDVIRISIHDKEKELRNVPKS